METSTPPVAEQPTSPVVAPVTTPANASNSKNLIIFGSIAAVIILAIVAVAVLFRNRSDYVPSQSAALVSSDPVQVSQELNTQVKDLVLALNSNDRNQLQSAIKNVINTTQGEFELSLGFTDEDSTTFTEIFVDGAAKEANGGGLIEMTATINTDILQLPISGLVLDIVIETKPNNTGTIYLKPTSIPAELSLFAAGAGIQQNTWYYVNLDQETVDSINTVDEDFEAVELYSEEIFTSSTATSNRTIAGNQIPCVQLTVNPNLIAANPELATYKDIEYCAAASGDPLYIGTQNVADGMTYQFGLSLKNLGREVNIEIPYDAKDLQQVLSNLGSFGI